MQDAAEGHGGAEQPDPEEAPEGLGADMEEVSVCAALCMEFVSVVHGRVFVHCFLGHLNSVSLYPPRLLHTPRPGGRHGQEARKEQEQEEGQEQQQGRRLHGSGEQ